MKKWMNLNEGVTEVVAMSLCDLLKKWLGWPLKWGVKICVPLIQHLCGECTCLATLICCWGERVLFVYVNLGYLGLFAVGFMHLCLLVLKWEHLEQKFTKFVFRATQKKCDFWKNVKNYSILVKRCDQTTWPTVNH